MYLFNKVLFQPRLSKDELTNMFWQTQLRKQFPQILEYNEHIVWSMSLRV